MNGEVVQSSSDCGEKGAGARILEGVIAKHGIDNVLVVVTRWYGGTPLGGARFRHIIQAALDLVKQK